MNALAMCEAIILQVEYGPHSAETEEHEWRAKLIQAKAAIYLQKITPKLLAQISAESENDNEMSDMWSGVPQASTKV